VVGAEGSGELQALGDPVEEIVERIRRAEHVVAGLEVIVVGEGTGEVGLRVASQRGRLRCVARRSGARHQRGRSRSAGTGRSRSRRRGRPRGGARRRRPSTRVRGAARPGPSSSWPVMVGPLRGARPCQPCRSEPQIRQAFCRDLTTDESRATWRQISGSATGEGGGLPRRRREAAALILRRALELGDSPRI